MATQRQVFESPRLQEAVTFRVGPQAASGSSGDLLKEPEPPQLPTPVWPKPAQSPPMQTEPRERDLPDLRSVMGPDVPAAVVAFANRLSSGLVRDVFFTGSNQTRACAIQLTPEDYQELEVSWRPRANSGQGTRQRRVIALKEIASVVSEGTRGVNVEIERGPTLLIEWAVVPEREHFLAILELLVPLARSSAGLPPEIALPKTMVLATWRELSTKDPQNVVISFTVKNLSFVMLKPLPEVREALETSLRTCFAWATATDPTNVKVAFEPGAKPGTSVSVRAEFGVDPMPDRLFALVCQLQPADIVEALSFVEEASTVRFKPRAAFSVADIFVDMVSPSPLSPSHSVDQLLAPERRSPDGSPRDVDNQAAEAQPNWRPQSWATLGPDTLLEDLPDRSEALRATSANLVVPQRPAAASVSSDGGSVSEIWAPGDEPQRSSPPPPEL